MKIIATARSRNEEKHVRQYCEAYSEFADIILIADGGSEDDTVKIALEYPKVMVRDYPVQVQLRDGSFRNPDGDHIQFLVDWAIEIGGDWIVHQDMDQRPNKYLKQDAHEIMEQMDEDFLQATQIFLWGKDQFFPDLSNQRGFWMPGLWAWRLSINLKIIDAMPHYMFSFDGTNPIDINKIDQKRVRNLLPPYCYLHYGWETPESTWEHVNYYRKTGLIENMQFPTGFGGRPAPLLAWMEE